MNHHPPSEYVCQVDGVVIRPINSAVQQTLKKTASQIVSLSTVLKQSPIAAVGRSLDETLKQLARPGRADQPVKRHKVSAEPAAAPAAPVAPVAATVPGVPGADVSGALMRAQYAFMADQQAQWSQGSDVHPSLRALFSGQLGDPASDPALLVGAFVRYACQALGT